MSANLLLNCIKNLLPGGSRRARRQSSRATKRTAPTSRPAVELLEDRLTPSTVTSLGDSGPGTLRDAISAGGTVTFAVPANSTINLASTLDVTTNVTIDGTTAPGLAINGNGSGSVFHIESAVTNANFSTVTIEGGSTSAGGGILNEGTLTLTNCTISNNNATLGGGINNSGTLSLSDCTVANNHTVSDGGGFLNTGTLSLSDCTVTNNTGDTSGGGGIKMEGGTLTLSNSIVSGNGNTVDIDGNFTGDYNLIGSTDGTFDGPHNIVGGDPMLASLANNGGPTQTVALIPGSPAAAAGDPTHGGTLDQRGILRPAIPDIGAFELERITPSSASIPNTTTTMTIAGSAFSPDASNDTITFDNGVTGNVTAATSTSLTVAVSGLGSVPGGTDLHASVTVFGVSSGAPVQVATVTAASTDWVVTDPNGATGSGSPSDITLPYAVTHAQDGDSITFASSLTGDTITVSNTLDIATSVTIDGSGSSGLAVNGNASNTVFHVESGVTASISNLTIENGAGNLGTRGTSGGGILNEGNLTVTNSTIDGNATMGGSGAGIYNADSATLTLNNDTIVNNTTSSKGGGIASYGTMNISDCTIAYNFADSTGGGITIRGGTLALSNSIVDGNTGGADLSGSGATGDYNVIGFADGGLITGTGNQYGVDALLGSLGNYGGPTPTVPLMPGSPAAANGDPAQGGTLDQRGILRPANPDVGAFELERITPSSASIPNTTTTMTIVGSAYSPDAANDTITFDNGVTGSVTAATSTTLTVAVSGLGSVSGGTDLHASVTVFGVSSGAPVQVATITSPSTDWVVTDSNGAAGSGSPSDITFPYAVAHAQDGDSITFGGFLSSGGVVIVLDGSLELATDVTIDGSGSPGLAVSGGGAVSVFNVDAGVTASISNMTIENGTPSADEITDRGGSFGGGIYNLGTLTLTACTITANSAGHGGGGIDNASSATLNLINCTVFGNSGSDGGGIFSTGSLSLTDTTLSGNSGTTGGGICNTGGTVTLSNSIVAGNNGGDLAAGAGVTADHSVIGGDAVRPDGVAVSGTGNQFLEDADPGLESALADNGGLTPTLALLPTSPAIAGGGGSFQPTDQRGIERPANPDAGAFELQRVTLNTADLPNTSTTMTINGSAFSPNAANDTVTFDNGVTGVVTAATSTSLTVSLTGLSSVADGTPLGASVTVFGVSSGDPVQVATVTAGAEAPAFESIEVNGGTPQYIDALGNTVDISHQNSVVEQILVTFNEPVTLAPGAFSVVPYSINNGIDPLVSGEVLVNSGPNPNQVAPLLNDPIQVGDGHQWIITFGNNGGTTPNGVGFYVLKDGVYSVNIDHTKVTANSQHMAADVGGPGASSFWVLYGDTTFHDISGVDHPGYIGDTYSDASVGNADFQLFKACSNSDSTNYYAPPNYDVRFDANLDGSVANSDFAQFKTNYNTDWQF
jgi:fibronectin-binding autotransporter adhesin